MSKKRKNKESWDAIGKAIKRARESAGISQKDLAERVETSATYLSQVENGKRLPSLKLLMRCAEESDHTALLMLTPKYSLKGQEEGMTDE